MDIPILYEDADIVAIAKPSGLITHYDGRTDEPTAENWFKENYPSGVGYAHRLDRDTSGVLVFAKTQNTYDFLREAFHNREVKKTYLAIVYGVIKEKKGSINFDIGRSRKDFRLRSAQPKAKGRLRDAITRYEVVDQTKEYTLLKVNPETGRTHQIRVHMKAIHHPIINDVLYAQNHPHALGITRLGLHAYKISLPLLSGVVIDITAPVPEDISQALSVFPKAHDIFAL